jgi:hypothetical protein
MAAGKAFLRCPNGSNSMQCGTTRRVPCLRRVLTWELDLAQMVRVLLELATVESRLA